MTRDLGDRTDPATAVRRVRWFSPRARRRGAAVATVDEATVDLRPDIITVAAYEQLLDNCEQHIEAATNAIDVRMVWTRQRELWAGLTQEQMLARFADELLEIRHELTGKAKP